MSDRADMADRCVGVLTADEIPFDGLSAVQLQEERVVVTTLCEQAGCLALTADSPIEDLVYATETLADLMDAAKLDDTRRAMARVRLLQHCRAEKIKDARSLIDAVLKPKAEKKSVPAAAVTLVDDEPCPEPVAPAALLDATATLIRRHIVLTPAQADALTLWIAAAHLIGVLSVMPILLISAPTMRAGKTTLLMLLSALVPRALVSSNITGAVLVRLIARFAPTLLLDEADTWLRSDDADMRGVINAGEYRQTAVVYRCAPDTHEPQAIPCFAARVLAMIGRPAPTIVDRSILIALRRKKPDERVERMRLDTLRDEHEAVRRQWRRVADDLHQAIQDTAATLPDAVMPAALQSDRARGHWRPLLAIAHQVGGDWPARAAQAAGELAGDVDTAEVTVDLLRDIRDVFDEVADRTDGAVASGKLLEALIALEDRPWKEWSKGRPLSGAKLARLLKGLDIHPAGSIRLGGKPTRAYRKAAFEEAWDRYLPIDNTGHTGSLKALQRDNANDSGAESPISKRDNANDCHALKSVTNPANTEVCNVVTLPAEGGERRGRF